MDRMRRRRRPSPSDRRGELLALAREDAATRRPADLGRQWTDDATVRPSATDQRTATAYDALALESAPEYEALLLSPVAPLGTSTVVAPMSQDRILTTIRPNEVVSDPTNVLALEAARRLRDDPAEHVRLCTAHQVLRMQPVPPGVGFTRHFRLFSLLDAGPSRPYDGFEVDAVVAQLGIHLRILTAASERFGLQWRDPVAKIFADDRLPAIADRLSSALSAAHPDIGIEHAPLESAYYGGLRVKLLVHDRAGTPCDWIDLGAHDWVARLTSNGRQRCIASAVGIQLLPQLG